MKLVFRLDPANAVSVLLTLLLDGLPWDLRSVEESQRVQPKGSLLRPRRDRSSSRARVGTHLVLAAAESGVREPRALDRLIPRLAARSPESSHSRFPREPVPDMVLVLRRLGMRLDRLRLVAFQDRVRDVESGSRDALGARAVEQGTEDRFEFGGAAGFDVEEHARLEVERRFRVSGGVGGGTRRLGLALVVSDRQRDGWRAGETSARQDEYSFLSALPRTRYWYSLSSTVLRGNCSSVMPQARAT